MINHNNKDCKIRNHMLRASIDHEKLRKSHAEGRKRLHLMEQRRWKNTIAGNGRKTIAESELGRRHAR